MGPGALHFVRSAALGIVSVLLEPHDSDKRKYKKKNMGAKMAGMLIGQSWEVLVL